MAKKHPLQQWTCDECGETIGNPSDGYVEWLREHEGDGWVVHGFRIVHHASASPRKEAGHDCYLYAGRTGRADLPLGDFLGPDGLVRLLMFLDVGPIHDPDGMPQIRNTREYVELFRRLQLPYYEEARTRLPIAQSEGSFQSANEVWPYLQSTLKELVERYPLP
jgi:hypothetical protein